jgi:hypothetical protein
VDFILPPIKKRTGLVPHRTNFQQPRSLSPLAGANIYSYKYDKKNRTGAFHLPLRGICELLPTHKKNQHTESK